MRLWLSLGLLLLISGLVACGGDKNPCVERAEIGCQMGLSMAQGEDLERAKKACEEAKESAAAADAAMQKKCAQDVAAFRGSSNKASLTPNASAPAPKTAPALKRSKTGEPILTPTTAASTPKAP